MISPIRLFQRSLAALACTLVTTGGSLHSADTPAANDSIDPALARSFFSDLNLDYPGLEEVKKSVSAKDWDGAARQYLQFRQNKSTAKWKFNPSDKPAKASKETDAEGDLIIKHMVVDNIYHMARQPIQLGNRIDWSFNPVAKSDPSYTKEFQWCVLNRHHMWEGLGKAYWSTLDDKYTREWMAQLEAWITDCPLNPAWDLGTVEESHSWRLIETGIRMLNTWPNTYYRFIHSPAFTPKAHLLYASSTLTQARHLSRFLKEFPNRTGNHVDMESTGLATVGCLFPELRESNGFIKTATDRMTKQIGKQVYPDGAQNELTPGYHAVSMDCFWDLSDILVLNNRPVPPEFDTKLKAMHRFLVAISDSRGEIPLFNDSWHFNVKGYAYRAFKRWENPEFQFMATRGAEGTPPPLSEPLPYSGFYTMRSSWAPDALYSCFRGGPVGTGHWHEGKLHFVLTAFEQPLVIDVGRGIYDESEWRYFAIGSTSRNTITVDGKEQHRGGVVGTTENVEMDKACDNPWMTSNVFDYVSATYDSGYQKSEYLRKRYLPIQYTGPVDNSIAHTRHFFFIKPDYFVAVDFLDGSGSHRYDSYFHLDAPDASIKEGSQSVVTQGNAKANILLYPLDTEGLKVRIAKGQEKPILGWIPDGNDPQRKIPTVVYTKEQAAPASFATVFYPFKGGNTPTVQFEKINAGSHWGRKIETPAGVSEIIIRRGKEPLSFSSSLLGQVQSDARTAVLSKRQGDPDIYMGLNEAASFSAGGKTVSFSKKSSVLLKISPDKKTITLTNLSDFSIELTPQGSKISTLKSEESLSL